MRIFLDTNVLVSAVPTRGLCADVLREALLRHQRVISSALIDELKKEHRIKIGVPGEYVTDLVELLQKDSYQADDSTSADVDIDSKDDITLLGCAM